MLHFDFEGQSFPNGRPRHVGDVHPFWHKGKLYLYYLRTDGSFSSQLLTSTDLLHFSEKPLGRIEPVPAVETYYVLGVSPYQGGFVSYFGASDTVINGSFSENLTDWSRLPDAAIPRIGYRTGRDPFLFFDPETARWRIVYTAYRSSDKAGDFDAALSLLTSRTERLEDGWEPEERELVRFDNAGLSRREDPECSQMMRVGERWYLFYSVYSRSVHGVGGLSYKAGGRGVALEDVCWKDLEERGLDGEDICAAQVFPMDGKTYLLGWVPQDPETDDWGGALSLLREVYPLQDGSLGLRLPGPIYEQIKGDVLFTLSEPITGEKKFAQRSLYRCGDRLILEAKLTAEEHARWGFVFREKEEYSLTWDGTLRISGYDRIARPRASCPGLAAGEMDLKLVLDGGVMDVFLNDRYSLAARLTPLAGLEEVEILFFSQGRCSLNRLEIRRLGQDNCNN